ncbi:MAG: CocE/NonD family hydrolase [Paramuribaculum sp.]|nr:CocE/NonD family hydrolase [Paramuribaculum sp.]
MNRLIKTIFLAWLLIASAPMANALTGSWRGELVLGPNKLPLVFNFSEDGRGVTQCTFDSPNQGAKGIPTMVLYCSADSVWVACSQIGASYGGRIADGTITGTFSQGGYSFPLVLKPETPIDERRPQTPRPPYPYTTIDTAFTAPDGAVMSATLTLPADVTKGTRVPAVVMVTGSGPQNRDEELFEHKPFAVIADYLARNGIASLRYDDRGTAKSGGDFASSTIYTFKDDAAAAIGLLRSLPEVGSVGVIGHSEGGTIAFMLGAEGAPDFIVSLGGMAVSGKETILSQNAHSLARAGITGAEQANCLRLLGLVFDEMADQYRRGVSQPVDVDSIATAEGIVVNPALMASLRASQGSRSDWYDAFLGLDARRYLEQTKCPVLAVNGGKDTQVSPANLDVVKALVPEAQTLLLPELNHLLQHATTGEMDEYGEIRETISPEALAAMAAFIKGL